MHLGHWHRATRLTKTDADISVGGRLQRLSRWQLPGAASCPYDEVTNTVTVVNSHWLPTQTGLYVDGYQPVPGVPRAPAGGSSLTAASQVGTWKWNPGADLWTSDASWPSASAPLVWPKGVSRHPESWAVLGQVEGRGGSHQFPIGKVFSLMREEAWPFLPFNGLNVGFNRNTTGICFMKIPRLHKIPLKICKFHEMAKQKVSSVCVCVVD